MGTSVGSRQSLRMQFVLPLLLAVLATGGVVAIVSKIAADSASKREAYQRMDGIGRLLIQAPFPLTPTVLSQIQELTQIDFAILDSSGNILASSEAYPMRRNDTKLTRSRSIQPGDSARRPSLASHESQFVVNGRRFPVLEIHSKSVYLQMVDRESSTQFGWQAFALPLITGLLSSAAIALAATWIASRITSRITVLKREVEGIAEGDFSDRPITGPEDDLRSLQHAIHKMSKQLELSQNQIASNERTRMIHLIASGLAHELRNHLTGASLALQTCTGEQQDREAIDLARKQLQLAEGQIRRLLAVRSSMSSKDAEPGSVFSIHRSVIDLVQPIAHHRQVHLDEIWPPNYNAHDRSTIEDSPSVHNPLVRCADLLIGAILNLAINAMEAAGIGGYVSIRLQVSQGKAIWTVADNGPGPSADIVPSLFEAFATTKPEGVGLGLAMCKRVANELGGGIKWYRSEEKTVFELQIPWMNSNPEPNGNR